MLRNRPGAISVLSIPGNPGILEEFWNSVLGLFSPFPACQEEEEEVLGSSPGQGFPQGSVGEEIFGIFGILSSPSGTIPEDLQPKQRPGLMEPRYLQHGHALQLITLKAH